MFPSGSILPSILFNVHLVGAFVHIDRGNGTAELPGIIDLLGSLLHLADRDGQWGMSKRVKSSRLEIGVPRSEKTQRVTGTSPAGYRRRHLRSKCASSWPKQQPPSSHRRASLGS
jgi:hypothetical protein